MDGNLDLLNLKEDKSIVKNLDPGGTLIHISENILLTCVIFKFNDYKAKQERNLMVTNKNVYNLKGTGIVASIQMSRGKFPWRRLRPLLWEGSALNSCFTSQINTIIGTPPPTRGRRSYS